MHVYCCVRCYSFECKTAVKDKGNVMKGSFNYASDRKKCISKSHTHIANKSEMKKHKERERVKTVFVCVCVGSKDSPESIPLTI